MPRVTYSTYCQRRTHLNTTWRYAAGNFTMLSAAEQWDLHNYYRHTEPLSEDELRRHWNQIQQANSSLPQRAGHAYAAFEPFLVSGPLQPDSQAVASVTRKGGEGGKRSVQVKGLVRPQIDIDKLVKVLMNIAREDLKGMNE